VPELVINRLVELAADPMFNQGSDEAGMEQEFQVFGCKSVPKSRKYTATVSSSMNKNSNREQTRLIISDKKSEDFVIRESTPLIGVKSGDKLTFELIDSKDGGKSWRCKVSVRHTRGAELQRKSFEMEPVKEFWPEISDSYKEMPDIAANMQVRREVSTELAPFVAKAHKKELKERRLLAKDRKLAAESAISDLPEPEWSDLQVDSVPEGMTDEETWDMQEADIPRDLL
jgi:hypothetical protein